MQLIGSCNMILREYFVMRQMTMLLHPLIVTWNNVFHQISIGEVEFIFWLYLCVIYLSIKDFINILMLNAHVPTVCYLKLYTEIYFRIFVTKLQWNQMKLYPVNRMQWTNHHRIVLSSFFVSVRNLDRTTKRQKNKLSSSTLLAGKLF